MSDAELPPAGWFDNPENPAEFRYWDGSAWTDHRAPKSHHPSPAIVERPLPGDASSTIAEAWHLLKTDFWPVFGIAALGMAGWLFAVILFIAGLLVSVEDGLDGLGSSGETEWDFSFVSVPLWGIAFFVYILPFLVTFPAGQVRFETTRRGRPASVGSCLGYAIRKIPRTLVRGLLLGLCWSAFIAATAALIFVGSLAGAEWLVIVFVGLPLLVYAVPFISVAFGGTAVAPPGHSPIRHALREVRGQWAAAAGAVYLYFLVSIGLGIVYTIVSLIPIVGLVVIAGYYVSYSLWLLVNHLQWLRLDGPVDPELLQLDQ